MELERLQRLRRYLGWLGMLVALTLLGAVLDIVGVRQQTPFNVLQVLPGQEVAIDGPLTEKTQVNELVYTSDSPDLEVLFDETYTGFWLGGQKWRGRLRVSPTAKAGRYLIMVRPRQPLMEVPPLPYRVYVHSDVASWRQSSPSFSLRYLGLAPGWLAGLAFSLLILLSLTIFWLSGQIDQRLAAAGLAEVYRVRRTPAGYEISFGLGMAHGLREGSRVWLLDPAGRPVEELEILEVGPTDAVARATGGEDIAPGYLVWLRQK